MSPNRFLPYLLAAAPLPAAYLLWHKRPWDWDLGVMRWGLILVGFGFYITAYYVAQFMTRARGPRWVVPLMTYFAVLAQAVLGGLAVWMGRWWMEYLPYLLIGLYAAFRLQRL